MSAETLIARLDGVRDRGHGRWIAKCPAHGDRSPSLSIRETGDGTILVKCFAGCGAADIVAAVGLELRDLFPAPLPTGTHSRPPTRHRLPASDRLAIIDREALAVCIIAGDLARGKPATGELRERLHAAARRIGGARDHG
ncbi:MAG: DNA primase [FCB group bacterium]|jgi:hypothetical protein|nr:DNA primase [FCB group bacterium]